MHERYPGHLLQILYSSVPTVFCCCHFVSNIGNTNPLGHRKGLDHGWEVIKSQLGLHLHLHNWSLERRLEDGLPLIPRYLIK